MHTRYEGTRVIKEGKSKERESWPRVDGIASPLANQTYHM